MMYAEPLAGKNLPLSEHNGELKLHSVTRGQGGVHLPPSWSRGDLLPKNCTLWSPVPQGLTAPQNCQPGSLGVDAIVDPVVQAKTVSLLTTRWSLLGGEHAASSFLHRLHYLCCCNERAAWTEHMESCMQSPGLDWCQSQTAAIQHTKPIIL